jgi:hypothetical protein
MRNHTLIFGSNEVKEVDLEGVQTVNLSEIRNVKAAVHSDLMRPITQAGTRFTEILN